MQCILFLVVFHISGQAGAQDGKGGIADWTDAINEVYSKFTQYFNQKNFDAIYRECFTNDSVELYPRMSTAREDGVIVAQDRLFELYRVEELYIAFRELLFSSCNVAIVRTIEYPAFVGGGQGKINGLHLLVRNEDGVKIKLTVFNFV